MAARGRIAIAIFLVCAILPEEAASNIIQDIFGRIIHPRPTPPGESGFFFLPPKDKKDPAEQKPDDDQWKVRNKEKPLLGDWFIGKNFTGQEVPAEKNKLRQGFYEQTCPRAEEIVKEALNKAFNDDAGLAAALVRLFFHDCFVTGCDASVLLDPTPGGERVEKEAPHNGIFIRGLEAIDQIKTQLEQECPGTVSCADILAFANRDSLVFSGVPAYNVASGRHDGRVSLERNVEGNVPLPTASAQDLIQLFNSKGLTLEELVVLVGAHSIGIVHCANIFGRIDDPKQREQMDPGFVNTVAFSCGGNPRQIWPFDTVTQYKMDSQFYTQLLKKKSTIESDQALANNPQAGYMMKKFADDQEGWLKKFTEAIVKLGELEVLTGDQGEIRKQCRVVN